jgi:N-acetylmuramoyl-L-alanine amidase
MMDCQHTGWDVSKRISLRLIIFSVCASVLFLSAGCKTVPVAVADHAPGTSLTQMCLEHGIQWQWDSLSQVMILRAAESEARVLVGSNLVLVGNSRVFLSSPVEITESQAVVPGDFSSTVFEQMKVMVPPVKVAAVDTLRPIIEPMDHALRKVRVVMIDAGHGGKDPGAIGKSGTQEKDVVLDIAKRLKQSLENQGLSIMMTRETDEFISLQERTVVSSSPDVDLFVSIHANSSPSKKLQGVEVYCLKDLDSAEKNESQRLDNLNRLTTQLVMDRGVHDLNHIVDDLLYSYKQAESDRLALSLAEKTSSLILTKNLGRKRARFFVLRNTLIPAVLVEVGFLSNLQEENLLKTEGYRQKIADAVAKSILDYVKS